MNRAKQKIFRKKELFKSNSTIKCKSCNALFPLEYFECPQCEIDFEKIKLNLNFRGG